LTSWDLKSSSGDSNPALEAQIQLWRFKSSPDAKIQLWKLKSSPGGSNLALEIKTNPGRSN
jgi:hypothetical protein